MYSGPVWDNVGWKALNSTLSIYSIRGLKGAEENC